MRNGGFPYVNLFTRDRLPQTSQAFRAISKRKPGFTEFAETHSMAWTNVQDLELFEQTRVATNGHAITLPWADAADDGDEKKPAPGVGTAKVSMTPRVRSRYLPCNQIGIPCLTPGVPCSSPEDSLFLQ